MRKNPMTKTPYPLQIKVFFYIIALNSPRMMIRMGDFYER